MITKRTLEKIGYRFKYNEHVGWWADGMYGYLVAGYFESEKLAVDAVENAIESAVAEGRQPSWMF